MSAEPEELDFSKTGIPESWACVDCGVNTAPGLKNRSEMQKEAAVQGKSEQVFDERTEVYHVRDAIWKRAGMAEDGGCLCIGCLEKRLGRKLKGKDFFSGHPLNILPGTPRLLQRRGR